MTSPAADAARFAAASAIARTLVDARLAARPLPDYPGPLPQSLAEAYQVQEAAIALWDDAIAGWKVGRVPAAEPGGTPGERLCGPIFARQVRRALNGETTVFPVLVGGFAAVEAEFVVRVGHDAPAGRTAWTTAEALEYAGALHIGVETAGSPMAAINAIGGVAVVSDFGNNAGVILGPEIPNWRDRAPDTLPCETVIEGRVVGEGSAASIPGGPLESLAFLLGHCAARGRPLRAGDLVATGAATGVHDILPGQSAVLRFGGVGDIRCRAEPVQPEEGAAR